MKLEIIAANQAVLHVTDHNGAPVQQLFFSYQTCVAAWSEKSGYLRTATKHSRTTERHIKPWLDTHTGGVNQLYVHTVPQDLLDCLIG